jgi:sulfide:quinone oxidoreductase
LELTIRLADDFGGRVEVTLIDQSDAFVFGFSKLDVMFGRTVRAAVRHPYRDIVKPGVTFVQTSVRSIDPAARRVETDAGAFECDILVVALGADLDPAATPGLAARPGRTSTATRARSRRATCSPPSRAAG